MCDECECNSSDKWTCIAIIVVVVTFGIYKMTELYYDKMIELQKLSQVVVEK